MRRWLILGLLCTLPLMSLRTGAAMPLQLPVVPPGHWSLEIVLQLIDHGVIESRERTFIERCQTGEETITRKEIALLIDEVESKSQSAEDKKLIEQLIQEYAVELSVLHTQPKKNPFADVPRSDWSFSALADLVQAGVIEVSSATFHGDAKMTRYEMAQLVAKASASNPTGEQKIIVDRLAQEYANELNTMGAPLPSPTDMERARFKLDISAKENTDWHVVGRLEGSPPADGAFPNILRYNMVTDVPMQSTEAYKPVKEQAFQSVLSAPLSSFGADVDTGAYSNVRRYIQSGSRPPRDAVRTEEMLNY